MELHGVEVIHRMLDMLQWEKVLLSLWWPEALLDAKDLSQRKNVKSSKLTSSQNMANLQKQTHNKNSNIFKHTSKRWQQASPPVSWAPMPNLHCAWDPTGPPGQPAEATLFTFAASRRVWGFGFPKISKIIPKRCLVIRPKITWTKAC